MSKYQEALDHIGEYAYEHDLYDSINTLQDLVDKYGAMYEDMIEDAKFLKEVVEPNWKEIYKAKPTTVLQAIKNDEFVGNTIIEPDYERALDKACELLEHFDSPTIRVDKRNKDEWREWLLKDE